MRIGCRSIVFQVILSTFEKTETTQKMVQTLKRVTRFYIEGFRQMTLGRTLWAIILIKLFIMFAILKLFFFPNQLAGKSPDERARTVMEHLTPEQPKVP